MPRGRNPKSKFTPQDNWVAGGELYEDSEVQMNIAPQEEEMMAVDHMKDEEAVIKKKPWEKIGPDGKVIKRKSKPNPKRRNALLRKQLHPKSAIMCLNELQTGLVYDVEAMPPVGNYVASVDVNGSVFRGYGTSKSNAKQAAAEAALVSFVKPPPPKPAPGQDFVEDETPWKCIASFAMYKLFSEWSEGRVGNPHMNPHVNSNQAFNPPAPVADLRQHLDQSNQQNYDQSSGFESGADISNLAHYLGNPAQSANQNQSPNQKAPKDANNATPKPAKAVSDEAKQNNHPVVVLHQLMPTIKYESADEMVDGSKIFTLTACVGTTPYAGTGSSVKKAKFALAKLILKEAYGIDNVYEAK